MPRKTRPSLPGAGVRTIFVFLLLSIPGLLSAGTTTRVSVASDGTQADSLSAFPALSADGRFVAFASHATNLVADDANGWTLDVFIHDRQSGVTELVSVDSSGEQGNGSSSNPTLSADGRFVAFRSEATNLVPGDTNGQIDVFVRDRRAGTTERVSIDSAGDQADDFAHPQGWGEVAISADGSIVSFHSTARDLDPQPGSNRLTNVIIRDRNAGTTERIPLESVFPGLAYSSFNGGALSADGRYVVVHGWEPASGAPGVLVAFVFVFDRATGTAERVSVASDGTPGDFGGFSQSISGNGRLVVFSSSSTNLIPDDTNGAYDVFLHDLGTGVTERLSVSDGGMEGNSHSDSPVVSANGRFVSFQTRATNLVPDDANGDLQDILVYDLQKRAVFLASMSSEGIQQWGEALDSTLSEDGRTVAFVSRAPNLVPGDTNNHRDVFVHEISRLPFPPAVADLAVVIPEAVAAGEIEPQLETSLSAKLDMALEAPTPPAQDGALGAFVNEVEAHSGDGIEAELAEELIAASEYLIDNN